MRHSFPSPRAICSALLFGALASSLVSLEADALPVPSHAWPDPIPTTWALSPSAYEGWDGSSVVFACPANPYGEDVGQIWGTDLYTDDSAICVAAVHAGVITLEAGGLVAVTLAPGRDHYPASSRYGVVSGEWGAWGSSFMVSTP